MTLHPHRQSRGFTLVELLVVIGIIAVLASLASVAAFKAIAKGKAIANISNLRNIGTAIQSYANEYGHFPAGDDASYSAGNEGPAMLDWQTSLERYPDLINAYLENPQVTDMFLSPSLGSKLVRNSSSRQPTNYIGHPALLWSEADRDSFPNVGEPPFSPRRVQRPSETMLLTDGVPSDTSDAKDCEASIGTWANDGSVETDDEGLGDNQLNLEPSGSGKFDYRYVDFRNSRHAHVLFVDGHVEAFQPADFRVRHVALGF